MPGNALENAAVVFTIIKLAIMALLGATARVLLSPGKTPRRSLLIFGGSFALGMLVAVAWHDTRVLWIREWIKTITGFVSLLGLEILANARKTVPTLARAFIRSVATFIVERTNPTTTSDQSDDLHTSDN